MLAWLKRKLIEALVSEGDMVVKVGIVRDVFCKSINEFERDLDHELEWLRQDALTAYHRGGNA